MANRVVKGFWDCPQCGTKGIDGLIDTCPGCGSGKDKNVRYYIKTVEEVSEEELAAAGISADENDGMHKEWVCAYCGFLNNYADETCQRCGAGREEKETDYEGDTSEAAFVKDKHGNLKPVPGHAEEKKKEKYQTNDDPDPIVAEGKNAGVRHSSPVRWILLAAAALLLAFLLWPQTFSEAITGFEWHRNVTVEELKTFSESGWTLPSGARQTSSNVEFYGYRQVLDHYETVYETRTRRVIDHYDVSYTYTDNGNGTFTENEVKTPVYTTETYEEPVRSPVYRNEPVYQTKYYYEIDRWISLKDYPTSGDDHEPFWSDEYTLRNNQRDTLRTEEYYTIYTDTINGQSSERKKTEYEDWEKQALGDGFYVTKCRLGIEYSRKEKGS